MKKKIVLALLMIICVFTFACGEKSVEVANAETDVKSSEVPKTKKVVKTIDVDLTKLSSTMVYSEVYQMVWHPEEYVGKVIKMNGQVSIFDSPDMNRTYYTCVIADATACCQQGIEFRLIGDKRLPDSYKEGDEVMVVGEFNTYKEGEKTYCELVNAKLL